MSAVDASKRVLGRGLPALQRSERLLLLAIATGTLMAACAPAWTALRLTATQFFTMAVTGAVGLSALGVLP